MCLYEINMLVIPNGINQTLIIKGELTDLNSYIRAERGNRYAAAKIKEDETYRVAQECVASKLKKMTKIHVMTCNWYCKNERKDTDNVEFAKKFIMDGLATCKIIPDDTRKYTGSTLHQHYIDKLNPRIEVVLEGI